MSELRELYQEVILDHNKAPRNFRKMAAPSETTEGFNPLCGDQLTLYVKFDGDVISDISFEGKGCAISKASASMMTENLKGKTRAEADKIFRKFHELVTAPDEDAPLPEGLGKLAVFGGVREFPLRVKCATLAWHTLQAALQGAHHPISTE